METTPPGTPPAEQPIGNQPTEQSPNLTGQPAQPAALQPSVEDLQAQLQQANQQLEQKEQNYRSLQGEFTRRSQALAQLTGSQLQQPQTPVDPIAPYVQKIVAQGYSEKDARVIAQTQYEMTQAMVTPLQQQFQQQQQTTAQLTQLDRIASQAYAKFPDLFPDQQSINDAVQAANVYVQRGGIMDERTLLSIANDNIFERRFSGRQPAAQQPQYQQPAPINPFANGMNRVQQGYSPLQPPANQPLQGQSLDIANEIANQIKNRPR